SAATSVHAAKAAMGARSGQPGPGARAGRRPNRSRSARTTRVVSERVRDAASPSTSATSSPSRTTSAHARRGPGPCADSPPIASLNTRCASRRSIRVAVTEAVPEGQDQDLEVEGQAPVFDVVEVALDPLVDRRVAPPAVDLRPAGDPRLDLVTEHVAGHPAAELLDEARALGARPDQAHLPQQHVPQLWQLVEAPASQERAESRSAR